MTQIKIVRYYTPLGAFGHLTAYTSDVPGAVFRCVTAEDPDNGNLRGISCIPEGEYALELGRYNRGGYPAYEVLGVEGRTHIKIHRGNTQLDVEGCIVLGEYFGGLWRAYLGRKRQLWAVKRSKQAFAGFMGAMGGKKAATLLITRYEPTRAVGGRDV